MKLFKIPTPTTAKKKCKNKKIHKFLKTKSYTTNTKILLAVTANEDALY